MIAKIQKFFQTEEKLAFKIYSPDFGGRSSRNAARFSGVTRNVLSNSKHTLLCSKEHKPFERLKKINGSKDILPCARAHQLKASIQCL